MASLRDSVRPSVALLTAAGLYLGGYFVVLHEYHISRYQYLEFPAPRLPEMRCFHETEVRIPRRGPERYGALSLYYLYLPIGTVDALLGGRRFLAVDERHVRY